ncbi:hypothetical protein M422DRAFT_243763 [Sphaerobolus stellatus SS14]|nr:hypothetical protein M422DRAFT_243763 [Sphaerobolus stellatus SS14]
MSAPSTPIADRGCALNSEGTLKEASQIEWQHSPSSEVSLNEACASEPPNSSPLAKRVHTHSATRAVKDLKAGKPAPPKQGGQCGNQPLRKATSMSNIGSSKPSTKKRHIEDCAQGTDPVSGADDEDDEEDDGEGAAQRQAMAKADMSSRKHPRGGAAKDVPLIFTKDVHGKESGHWCTICKGKRVLEHDSWFTGGNSSLRTHIARYYDTHYEIYAKHCKEASIQPHSRCIPAARKAEHEVPDPTLKQYGFQHEEHQG